MFPVPKMHGFDLKSVNQLKSETRSYNKRITRKGYSVPRGFLWTENFKLSNYVCQPPKFSALESFLFISSFGFSCFCDRVCSRTGNHRKFYQVKCTRYLSYLSFFLSIFCAQGRTHIKQCSMLSTRTIEALKWFCFFLRQNYYLGTKLVAFQQFPSNGNR